MATYDQLMVYKEVYDLTTELMLLTKKMDRGYKFTLGERINNECVEMLLSIYRINRSTTREPHFLCARERVEMVRLLLRLMKDLKLLSTHRFSKLNGYVESISKQMTGWHKSMPDNRSKNQQSKLF